MHNATKDHGYCISIDVGTQIKAHLRISETNCTVLLRIHNLFILIVHDIFDCLTDDVGPSRIVINQCLYISAFSEIRTPKNSGFIHENQFNSLCLFTVINKNSFVIS